MSPSEEYRRRLEEERKAAMNKGAEEKAGGIEVFVPFGTMYKLEDAFQGVEGEIQTVVTTRKLECLNCRNKVEWRIYQVAPDVFDSCCPECGMDAKTYWKNTRHRKVE